MHFESKVGHIGGNLSCLDALMLIFHKYKSNNDHFILSKGHAAGALYITLWSLGLISDEQLKTFHADGTKLAGHTIPNWLSEIPFATGSLGHGFSLAAGMALGQRVIKKPGKVFCLTSDGEWQEGSTWEALIFASKHELENLCVLVDCNGLQGFGAISEVAAMQRMQEKLQPFNVDVVTVNGHSLEELSHAVMLPANKTKIILMNTQKGYPISFMCDRMEWHYLPMTEEQYKMAVHEVEMEQKL